MPEMYEIYDAYSANYDELVNYEDCDKNFKDALLKEPLLNNYDSNNEIVIQQKIKLIDPPKLLYFKSKDSLNWNILNKAKTGGIGISIEKWNKEKCTEEASKYSTKKEFCKKCLIGCLGGEAEGFFRVLEANINSPNNI